MGGPSVETLHNIAIGALAPTRGARIAKAIDLRERNLERLNSVQI